MSDTPIPGAVLRLGNPSQDRKTSAFTNLGGPATDPSAVTLIVQRPDGTKLTYGWPVAGVDGPLTRESAGRFYATVAIDQSGTWKWRLRGTGAVTAVSERWVHVDRQQVL